MECHDGDTKKGGLDLTALPLDPALPKNFSAWVTIHDRVANGEMPPKKKARPEAAELQAFEKSLRGTLVAAEKARFAGEGRATQRRLNRYEYENVLRDLLHAPWLQIRDALPEDGVSYRYNKIGDSLDVSHVQMARYMAVADEALRQVMAHVPEQPETRKVRYYAREQSVFTNKMKFSVFNKSPERATFPVMGLI